jgi:nitrogenase molybdenum-cofactor synthesis protein NifE
MHNKTNLPPGFIPIGAIKAAPQNLNPGERLTFYCPVTGGYGIPRAACLVPESRVLFITPQGCGRHSVVSSYRTGEKERIHSLYIQKSELALGLHVKNVLAAAKQIARGHGVKALTLIYACVDDLMGTDYGSVAKQVEGETGLRVRVGAMNPIRTDTKKAPHAMIFKTIYSYLGRCEKRDERALNLLGNFSQLSPASEIHELLREAGGYRLRHISEARTFAEFESIASCGLNLLVGDAAAAAAEHMQNELGIPFHRMPSVFFEDDIAENYALLGRALGVRLDDGRFRARARERIYPLARELRGARMAVGGSGPYSPFEAARILVQAGAHVEAVFAEWISDTCARHIPWLQQYAPQVKVIAPNNRTALFLHESGMNCERALGLDAAYYANAPRYAELPFENPAFGYEGLCALLEQAAHPKYAGDDFEKLLFESNLVV